MEVLDIARRVAGIDYGKDASAAEHDALSSEQTSDPTRVVALQTVMKPAAVRVASTKTVYLHLRPDSLQTATVKLMDPLKRCMMTPETSGTCLVEELRSGKDEELPKLLEYHLEMVTLRDSLPFNAMLLVAHGTTSLFQSISAKGHTFSLLPYGVKGLRAITHEQDSARTLSQSAIKSHFSQTSIQDCSIESFKERGIRVLHFHTDSSKHDWQCFVDMKASEYVSEFGDSENSVFDNVMAATIELFESGRTLHERRLLRSGLVNPFEVIARANYLQNVERKRIDLDDWSEYLAELVNRFSANKTPLLVLRPRQSALNIIAALEKESATIQQERLIVKASSEASDIAMDAPTNFEPSQEPIAEQVGGSDRAKGDCGKGKTSSVNEHDWWDEEDTIINMPYVKTQTIKRAKEFRKVRKNTTPLKSTEGDDVVALNKSGSSPLRKRHSLVNTTDTPDTALYPIHGGASRTSVRGSSAKGQKPSPLLGPVKMNTLGSRMSAMALEGGREFSDAVGPPPKDSADDGWQVVTHGKIRKSSDKNPETTHSSRRGPPATACNNMARGRTAPRDRRAQALDNLEPSFSKIPALISSESSSLNFPPHVNQEPSSSKFPAPTAEVAPTKNFQEFPSLPTTTQSEEAIQKVMAKKKKKKAKRKKKREDIESESSQSSGDPLRHIPAETPPEAQRKTVINHDSFLNNIPEQGSHEAHEHDPDEAASVTNEEVTPNASMINLAVAKSSHHSSTSAPASASASNLQTIFVSPPVTTPTQPWVHKFDTIEGPRKIVCSKPGCDTITSPWDGSTVICPSCGPYSSIRYCCIEHLLSDTSDHWGVDCMRFTCHHLCDPSTIHPRQVQCPPAIPNLCGWNTPERHRQAVYHAHSTKKNGWAEVDGDYFIFSDAEEWIQAGSPDMQTWALRRARGAVLIVVTFDDERSPNSLKDRFNRLLNIALFTGACNAVLINHLFLMIRENLVSKGEWDDEILDSIVYQFQWEFCYQVPEWITNNLRHACPQQWFGIPIDQCHNRICNLQMLQPGSRHPLGPRISIKEKAEELERRYWILRVARVYHPNIQDPAMRMRGVGFDFVRPENRRTFCMGREWEGYPSGTMEVEDAMWSRTVGGPPCLQVANLMTLTV